MVKVEIKSRAQMAESIRRLDVNTFTIISQETGQRYYVTRSLEQWVCDCKDHLNRQRECKHLQIIFENMKKSSSSLHVQEEKTEPIIIPEITQPICRYCKSSNCKKDGIRKTKYEKRQIYRCHDCKRRFTNNHGFEGKHFSYKTITESLNAFFSGMSCRNVSQHIEMFHKIPVSPSTVYNWVAKFSVMLHDYLASKRPELGSMFRADEMWLKIDGMKCYLFSTIDDDTRYWIAAEMADRKAGHNADNLLEDTKKHAGKEPTQFRTDGLPSYMESSKKVYPNARHTRHIHLQGDKNNNKMERFNGTIRDRTKVFRGLKKMSTPLIKGLRVFYNFIRHHSALKEHKTPARQAGIIVKGHNKWKTLIQNASLYSNVQA